MSTNPFNIIDNQYVVGVDFFGERFDNAVRTNYETGSTQLILTGPGDSVGKIKTSIRYKGYQIGYSLKMLSNIQKDDFLYWGPEIRYSNRNYLDSILIEKKANRAYKSTRDLDAKGSNYELSINMGYLLVHNKVFLDIYGGIGAGYKSLTTDLDTNTYSIIDYRYKPEHWNKIYVFPRAGVRIGLVF
jgi:hypothetical protein